MWKRAEIIINAPKHLRAVGEGSAETLSKQIDTAGGRWDGSSRREEPGGKGTNGSRPGVSPTRRRSLCIIPPRSRAAVHHGQLSEEGGEATSRFVLSDFPSTFLNDAPCHLATLLAGASEKVYAFLSRLGWRAAV